MSASLKKWRDSASLLLVTKQPFSLNKIKNYPNYKLLTLERSSQSSFMPGSYVFPGGTLDKSDTTFDWLKLYKNFGIGDEHFKIFDSIEHKPPIYNNNVPNTLPKPIALRVSAIRETFEECGILLCKSKTARPGSKWATYIGGHEIQKWQKIVHDDPTQFYELCLKFEVYPDLWALHEWSNWLTPSAMRKRFDTVYYLAACESTPPAFAEATEAKSVQWATPDEYLEQNLADEIFLPPPQYYELSRLKNFNDFEELACFSQRRAVRGIELFLPYRVQTPNANYTILPGDSLYPGEKEAETPKDDIEEVPESQVMHRMYHKTPVNNKIIVENFVPKFEHLLPVTNFEKLKSVL